jgi:hypothetical protein
MRVRVQRFPLLVRSPRPDIPDEKELFDAHEPTVVIHTGVNALQRFGFGHIVNQSNLAAILEWQQKQNREMEKKEELTRDYPHDNII